MHSAPLATGTRRLCFLVSQGKSEEEPSLTPALALARTQATDIAKQLGRIQRDFGLSVDPEEYADTHLNFGLVEVGALRPLCSPSIRSFGCVLPRHAPAYMCCCDQSH